MKGIVMASYTKDDTTCPHCGGEITCHWVGRAIYWCDVCGSNNPEVPPNVSIDFHPLAVSNE